MHYAHWKTSTYGGDQEEKRITKNMIHKNDFNAYDTIYACEFKRLKAKFFPFFFWSTFLLLEGELINVYADANFTFA